MPKRTPVVSAPVVATRSLPPRANLEFERKRAKSLLRQLRRDNPSAKLADAQFITARELGFASWPRLVQYFTTLERESLSSRTSEALSLEFYEHRARGLVREHELGREWAGRMLAAFVPRFYGRSIAEVLASPITVDDARLCVARQYQCSSWDQLIEEADAEQARRGDPWTRANDPFMQAVRAIDAADLARLESIVDQHPELLHPSDADQSRGRSLITNAMICERRHRTAEARRVTEWLVSRGMDLGPALNCLLLGHPQMSEAEMEYLLDRGADVSWMPPNGVSILEHAIIRCMNGKVVDLIARRVTVRPRGLWVAAGLGDVAGFRRYFGRDGTLTRAAYTNRPPFHISSNSLPALPDADEAELLREVALVAAVNGRVGVVAELIDRGFPIDYTGWHGTSLLRLAIGQRDVAMVEMLLQRGADLDNKGEWPHASAREFARQMVERYPNSPELPKILELCGAGTIEEIRAEADRRRPSPPPLAGRLLEAIELAGDDAARQGNAEISDENLFIGLLRGPQLPLYLLAAAGVDMDRLHAAVAGRLHPATDKVPRAKLPIAADARRTIEDATAIAVARRRAEVSSIHMLAALVDRDAGFAIDLIVACGGTRSTLLERLAKD